MRLTIEQDNKILIINGTYETYDEIVPILKTMLEFLTFDSAGVCEFISDEFAFPIKMEEGE
jgi:hypothetical protein